MNSNENNEHMAFSGENLVDVSIPRFSYTTSVDEFPQPATLEYSSPAQYSADNLRAAFSLQLPYTPSGARAKVSDGVVDLSYDLLRHDPLRGHETTHVGRKHVPVQAPIAFRTSRSTSNYKMVLAPVSAALASDVVDKNVSSATTHIKVLFPESLPAETITGNARAVIRTLADQPFAPERLVWRMAALYLAAAWAEVNGASLFSVQRDLAPRTTIASVQAYDGVLAAWDQSTQPIAIRYEGMPDMVSPMISLLSLLGAREPLLQTTNRLALPTVATAWPALGNAHVYYTGPRLAREEQIGNICPELVWETAMLWTGQHGCAQLFMEYLATISALWVGPVAQRAPILQSDRFSLALPVSALQPTILSPIAQSYTVWRETHHFIERPSKHDCFLVGATVALLAGLGIRTYGYSAGMPYVSVISRASTERDFIYANFKLRGDAVGAMFQAQDTLRSVGCTGTLGSVLLTLCPEFPYVGALTAWWGRQKEAYQWDEAATYVTALPRCCALMGVVRPLHATHVPIAGAWYGPDIISAARTIEEALQGLMYVPDLQLAWQLQDARTGLTSMHPVKRVTNYRGSYSDWQFAKRYSKDFASIEMVFSISSPAGCITAHTGPMGTVAWRWYVTRPTLEEELNFSAPPRLEAGVRPHIVEPPVTHTAPTTAPAAPLPPVEEDSSEEDEMATSHEAGAGPGPGTRAAVEVPLHIRAKADKVRSVLHDAGQKPVWVDQLLLGIERQNETAGPWTERDREGRMRGAWDEVEQMEPLDVLRAVPNGARANTALLMSQLYRAAAPHAHSLSAARGWIQEAVRMGNRARALKTCSALTKVELEDWTSKSRVKKSGAAISDANIAQGIAAGVSAAELLNVPTVKKGGKARADPEAWEQLETGAQLVEASTSGEFELLVKLAYESGELDGSGVVEMLAYAPLWLPTASTSKAAAEESNPADETPPIAIDGDPAAVVTSPEVDGAVEHAELPTPAEAQAALGEELGKRSSFGSGLLTITMSQPMPPPTIAEEKEAPLPPQTITDNQPPLETGSIAETLPVQGTQRMTFSE